MEWLSYVHHYDILAEAYPQDILISEPVLKPTNREGSGRNGIWHKNALGCKAGLTLTLICVAAAGLLVVIQWEVWLRGDQWLTKDLIKSRIRRV